ncbi:MAG: hypothetical protein KatS3mg119_1169 [Rhodothalassiaceae bacterium]|nr:MAG: hypothetical protein KatS3mg119_1169 [Rhodothalassiaceae bacterium]
MSPKAGFHPHPRWTLVPVPDDALYLFSAREHRVIAQRRARLFVECWQELGTGDPDAVVSRLRERGLSAAEGYFAFEELRAKGFLESREEPPAPAELFLAALAPVAERPVIPQPAARPPDGAACDLLLVGGIDPDAMAASAGSQGLRIQFITDTQAVEAADARLVVLTDDYLRPALGAIDRRMRALGRPWLLAQPVGGIAWFGPVFGIARDKPGGCWHCLAQRLVRNREVEWHVARSLGREMPLVPARRWTPESLAFCLAEIAGMLAALRASRKDGRDALAHVTTVDVAAGSRRHHHLVRRPQCPACGDGGRRSLAPRPIRLRPTPKRFTADGGHRVHDPEETWRRWRHHVSPVTGAVSFLQRIDDARGGPARATGATFAPAASGTGCDDVMPDPAADAGPVPVHNYVAGENFAVHRPGLAGLKAGLRSKSAGKGMTDAQARASGLAEALERYSGVFMGEEPRRRARFVDFPEGAAIDPRNCMLFSDRQYAERAAWCRRGSPFQYVPEPFDEEAELDWSPVWSLSEARQKYLPSSYLYYGHPEGGRFCTADSNGCAAGNTIEEAVLQGFFELVERDAVAVWWYNRIPRPAVDLSSFDLPYIDEMAAFLERHHRSFWVLDLTHEFGIPVMAAVTRRKDKPAEDIVFAFGAHFDPQIALTRAVSEMAQFLPAVLHMPADGSGSYAFDDPDSVRWWQTGRLAEHPHLAPAADSPARRREDHADLSQPDIAEDVRTCLRLVDERGMEMLVVDQTRPDIGLPVVKVIVPGMRHFWARFAPGRLYDVPVALGWLGAPLREEELNLIPMFI